MRCGVVLALLAICPGIAVADVWEFRSDGTSVFHQQVAKAKRANISTSRSGVVGSVAQRRALYDPLIQRISREEGVDPKLVHAMIQVESAYDPNVVSVKGAQGLMQLMPATAKYLGVDNPYDINQNIKGGTKYLAKLLKYYDGDMRLALAAYNAGPGTVKKYGNQVPPYPETLKYIEKVFAKMKLQKI